jgi:dTMP kinase
MPGACFISFEGVDGAGKSTQLEWVGKFLKEHDVVVSVTREPGGTPLGEKLREILLNDNDGTHPETEALLMFAARREHLEQVIAPALARGDTVLCDRFSDASFAYQGGGSGVDSAKLEVLENWVHPDIQPDLTLYFDLPIEVARQRVSSLRDPDRFEREGDTYFDRVRAAYLARARAYPERIRVIDASETPQAISAKLKEIISIHCL